MTARGFPNRRRTSRATAQGVRRKRSLLFVLVRAGRCRGEPAGGEPPLRPGVAARAGGNIDIFNRTVDALAYHGQLSVLVEAFRIAWPGVKSSKKIVSWGVSGIHESGGRVRDLRLPRTHKSPRSNRSVLLERVKYFVDDPRIPARVHQRSHGKVRTAVASRGLALRRPERKPVTNGTMATTQRNGRPGPGGRQLVAADPRVRRLPPRRKKCPSRGASS